VSPTPIIPALQEVDEDGVEDAFELTAEIPEKIRTGIWVRRGCLPGGRWYCWAAGRLPRGCVLGPLVRSCCWQVAFFLCRRMLPAGLVLSARI
jgi:hypothetical protein